MANLENPSEAKLSGTRESVGLRVTATVLRSVFILELVVLILRVSMPQSETIWTAYDTPSDLVRMILGLAVAAWLVVQLFRGPKDANSYRTWLYVGIAGVPFALVCLIAIW